MTQSNRVSSRDLSERTSRDPRVTNNEDLNQLYANAEKLLEEEEELQLSEISNIKPASETPLDHIRIEVDHPSQVTYDDESGSYITESRVDGVITPVKKAIDQPASKPEPQQD